MDGQQDFEQLEREHRALLRAHGLAQRRCSALLAAQAAQIERLDAQLMRLRGTLLQRDTALAWARDAQVALEQAIAARPPRRAALVLVSSRRAADGAPAITPLSPSPSNRPAPRAEALDSPDEADALEASLRAADLVICQTGCLSHGAYWRVQDHCRRTGKACVLVEAPEALRIMRIHRAPGGAGAAEVQADPAPRPSHPEGIEHSPEASA